MLRSTAQSPTLLLVLTAALAPQVGCSSSSPATSGADGGADSHTTHPVEAGKDSGKDATSDATKPGHDSGADVATDAPTGASAPVARFSLANAVPNLMDVPFPSDLYLTSAGTIVDPLPGASSVILANTDFVTHELGVLDGFSRIAQSLFYVDDSGEAGGIATIDPSSLPVDEAACVANTSSVFLVDLSATGTAARIPCRAAFHDDRAISSGGYRPVIAAGPGRGVVLQEGHQYATVLTSRVKAVTGKAIAASPDFTALSGPQSKSSLYAMALGKASTLLGAALGTDTIVDMALFTTNSSTKVLLQMRNNLESVTVPTLAWDAGSLKPMGQALFGTLPGGGLPTGFTATLDQYLGTVTAPAIDGGIDGGIDDPNLDLPVRAHDKLAAIGTAVFQAQNYLSPSGGYSVVGGATFAYDAMGNVVPDTTKPTAPIWVTFFIPNTPMPATGFPVVIVQHGLGESRADEPFDLANTFAAQGWMTAAIDSVTFGARAPEASHQIDAVNNFASGGGDYTGPDGLADAPTNGLDDLFGNLLDVGAIRDQFRQAEIDTSQLARVLASNPSLAPLATNGVTPVIDATKIAYFGNSLGAIQGAAATATEPLIKNWVLNVAGGGVLLELAPHSPLVAAELTFAGLNFGAMSDRLTETHPLINFLQTLTDPGDSENFAPYSVKAPATVNGQVLPPKNILQISVVYDEYVPNESNEALARAFGMNLAGPNVGTNSGVSTMAEVKSPMTIPDRLPLTTQNPDDAGLIHDTPVTGTTAVLVQTIPGVHGNNFLAGQSTHTFAIPYNQYDAAVPFVKLGTGTATADPPFSITCSYLYQQAMAVRFLTDAFAGKVPNVTGFLPPVRDFDGDGYDDAIDSDPNNPDVH